MVLTLPDEPAKAEPTTAAPTPHAPFQLSDGHTYVEHAGMTIEQELYRSLCSE